MMKIILSLWKKLKFFFQRHELDGPGPDRKYVCTKCGKVFGPWSAKIPQMGCKHHERF